MINYSDYIYYPSLRSRASELEGLANLQDSTKDLIVPSVSLCRHGKNSTFNSAIDKVFEAFDNPFIVDLTTSSPIEIDGALELASPEDNYESWVRFLLSKRNDNVHFIPTALISKGSTKRQFVQQVLTLEQEFGQVAIRVNPLHKQGIQAATLAASTIEEISNAVFIIDAGQISIQRQRASLDACIRGINTIRNIEPSSEIVVTGSSFPRGFTEYGRRRGSISMLERQNYKALGGSSVAIYGDYASIHGAFYPGSYAKFAARIDYPTPGNWIFERRSDDAIERQDLYQSAAQAIIADEEWDDELQAWGVEKIRDAAAGSNDGMNAPGKWIAVRMNLHIERMVQFIQSDGDTTDGFEDDIDWDDEDEFLD